MTYMLKHKEFGIYQGSCMGMGFWHPMSNMPEQGLCEFAMLEDIKEYKDFLCSNECAYSLNPEHFEILPFDTELNKTLLKEVQ